MVQFANQDDREKGTFVVESTATQLHKKLDEVKLTPTFIVAYVSPYLDIDRIGKIISHRFPDTPKSICSTAGELNAEEEDLYCETGHFWDRIIVHCFDASIIESAEVVSLPLGSEDLRQGRIDVTLDERIERLKKGIQQLDIKMDIDHRDTLALTFFDGLSNSESFFLEALYDSNRFPCLFVGGSAGGKLDFQNTWLHDGSNTLENHVLISFLKMSPGVRFGIMKSQNFTPTDTFFSILSASVEHRYVNQVIDAEGRITSFIDALCTVFKCNPKQLENKLEDYSFAIQVGDELFIRSILQIDTELDRVRFYCDLFPGEKLLLVKKGNLRTNTQSDFEHFMQGKPGYPVAGILNDCILRRLLYEQQRPDMGHVFKGTAIAGLTTFGETLGLYLNQTLTAVFFFQLTDGDQFQDNFVDNFPIYYGQCKAFYLQRKVAKLEGLSKIVTKQIGNFKQQHYDGQINTKGMDSFMAAVVDGLNDLGQVLQKADTQHSLKAGQIEQALRDSEERFRLLSESALTGIYLIQDGKFTYVNKAFARMFGYGIEEILDGMPLLQLVYPEDHQLVTENIRRRETGEDQYIRYPFRGQRKNGSIFHLEVHGGRIIFQGKVGVIGTFIDITEQKNAEIALRASEERFRVLYNETPSMFFTVNSEGVITAANDFAATQLGYLKEELVGSNFIDTFHEEDKDQVADKLSTCFSSSGDVVSWQHRKKLHDGTSIWCEEFARSVTDEDGTETIFIDSQDITERKQLEESLRVSQFIFDQASLAIFLVSEGDYRIFACNEHACLHLGYTKAELCSLALPDIYPTVNPEMLDKMRDQLSRTQSATITTKLRRKNGEIFPVQIFISTMLYEGRRVGVNFVTDITDLEKARLEQEKLKAQLEQVQKLEAIGRLAGGVAHDLNNLLTPILGYAGLISNSKSLDPKTERKIDHISKAALGARELVKQLLAFSRKQVLEYRQLELGQLVEDFSILLKRTIRENIELSISHSPERKPIYADQGQIEQVLMNLVVNASDAMPEGGKLSIQTSLSELDETYVDLHPDTVLGECALLSVSDTGVGMDDETVSKIYEPFFSTKGELGTGLGLATVYGIVKQHKGNIWVYSEPGVGTTFKIYLPIDTQQSQTGQSDKEIELMPKGTETILLVEDNTAVRTTVSDILRQNGYQVLVAESGESALKTVRHDTEFDLLLTDVIMPGMNGKELFKKLSAKFSSLKVIYMSGYMDDVIAHHGVLEEGINFIQKPFSTQVILQKLRNVLDG